MNRFVLLTLAAALCFLCAEPSMARKKKKKKEVFDYYASLPQPDAPYPSLTPQPPLAPEFTSFVQLTPKAETEVKKPLHVANKGIGGIDVSHYQGNINWKEVARDPSIKYVYLKATEGAKLIDDTYKSNLRGAHKANLKVGAYHFFNPTSQPRDQFRNFSSVVKLRDQDLIPIIDIEHRGKLPLRQFQNNLRQFIQMVEKHYGVRPILYTSRDFYNKYLSGPFTGYKYMIARYHPDIPNLCDQAQFVMWQYSATSRVRGIKGNVDRSCMIDQHTLSDILLP